MKQAVGAINLAPTIFPVKTYRLLLAFLPAAKTVQKADTACASFRVYFTLSLFWNMTHFVVITSVYLSVSYPLTYRTHFASKKRDRRNYGTTRNKNRLRF